MKKRSLILSEPPTQHGARTSFLSLISSCVPARRLYPDMAFFQRPTDYPCLLILDPQNEFETLRRRVEQTTLKSQTVARNRSGVTNVSSGLGAGLVTGQGLALGRGRVILKVFSVSLSACAMELRKHPSRY